MNVALVKVEVNGVRGTFIIDIGASYVSIESSYAERAKIRYTDQSEITFTTANGLAKGNLSKADTVLLGKLEAKHVPVVVTGMAMPPPRRPEA